MGSYCVYFEGKMMDNNHMLIERSLIIMGKHLTLDERTIIQVSLGEGKTLGEIAKTLGKATSTISREVRNHAATVRKGAYGYVLNECVHRHHCRENGICISKPDCVTKNCRFCKECNSNCSKFEREVCSKLSTPPYVCNGCPQKPKCTLEKRMYDAKLADKEYRNVLSESREGFNLTEDEFRIIDSCASECIDRGLSVYNIVHNHSDTIMCSESTLYRLVHSSALSARTIDLPRAVRFKARKGKKKQMKIDKKCTVNRTYEDFKKFISDNPDLLVTEMDTVEGKKGGKVLLTFMIPNCSMMLAFIRDHNDSKSVIDIINWLYSILPRDVYDAIFKVILTDNGSEFSNPVAIEFCGETKRSNIFYCNPNSPHEKPRVENNHTMIRRIIPKGISIDHLNQDDVDLMMSHINSYSRRNLNGFSPAELFVKFYGAEALHLLRQQIIPEHKILLKPRILKK